MRRRWVMAGVVVAVLVLAAAIHHFVLGASTVEGRLGNTPATSVIGSGKDAVGVSSAGAILAWQPPPSGALPRLPIAKSPKQGLLAGPMLQQALVLGAAPAVLRSCIDGSSYGESGVDVKLASGIELRFGGASRAAEKWSSAAAILADPAVTGYGYVDLHSPSHASTGGSGPTLPAPEPGAGTTCRK